MAEDLNKEARIAQLRADLQEIGFFVGAVRTISKDDAGNLEYWLKDCTNKGGRSAKTDVYQSYSALCIDLEVRRMARGAFFEALLARGYREHRSASMRSIDGLTLKGDGE